LYANLNELVDIGDLEDLKGKQTIVQRKGKPGKIFTSDQLQHIVDFVNKNSKIFKY
jgi:hypothetical protein